MPPIDVRKLPATGWRATTSTQGASLRLTRTWDGGHCTAVVANVGGDPAVVDEVIIMSTPHTFAPDTPLYGEGFQMLSQYGGTIASRRLIGEHEDAGHYRLPEPSGWTTVYNLALLSPAGSDALLVAFTSCDHFNGQVRISASTIEAVVMTEGLTLAPGETWSLEGLMVATGERDQLLTDLGARIAARYGRPKFSAPHGWCSWYWYWENVTEKDVSLNAQSILDRKLPLRYIQIDDGYQRAMGDWLIPKEPDAPPRDLCAKLSAHDLEPAIWVAPFIAERGSVLAAQHPDWFLTRDDGTPLPSDEVTFGGWRQGPWLMLDLTKTAVLDYLSTVFRTMREDWGCRYFKLDATVWGAFPWGHRSDRSATTVEAYRNAMTVIRDAVGQDSIILGCNAPMWPSLGLVDVMRSTGDVARRWPTLAIIMEEGMCRQWQHTVLWVNDPDCLVMLNQAGDTVTQDEYAMLRTYILAVGGSVFSGDELLSYDARQADLLRAVVSGSATGTRFASDRCFATGTSPSGVPLAFLFNWSDEACDVRLHGPAAVDYWTGEYLSPEGTHDISLPPRSARVVAAAGGGKRAFVRGLAQ